MGRAKSTRLRSLVKLLSVVVSWEYSRIYGADLLIDDYSCVLSDEERHWCTPLISA